MSLLLGFIFSLSNANGAGGCLASFSSNLNAISGSVSRLSRACWTEVQRGEGNAERIMSTCTQSELNVVAQIRDYRDANRALCNSDCRSELNMAKVCVSGRSLQYYMNQARGR